MTAETGAAGGAARPRLVVAASVHTARGNEANELCALLRQARTAWPAASNGPAPAQYVSILKAVEKARKDLRSRKSGAVYAKLLRELDAPHVLLRAPRRRAAPVA